MLVLSLLIQDIVCLSHFLSNFLDLLIKDYSFFFPYRSHIFKFLDQYLIIFLLGLQMESLLYYI